MMQIRLLPRTTLQILARPAAPHGLNGWTPVFATAQDGDRRVQQVVNWIGGEGDKPMTGWYVGPSGFVEGIAQAVDIRGITGTRGWSPVFSIVSDALRRVQMLSDWTGGTGTKPATTENGNALYVGATGFTTVLADAIDIRGPQGTPGWSPVLAIVADGERRVQQVFDWTGGEGNLPIVGQYISSSGLTSNIAEATDIRGAQGATGPEWTPTNNSITNALLANMPANTIKARAGTAGGPQDLNAAQAWDLIGPAGKASAAQVVEGTNDEQFITSAQLRANSGWRIINIVSATTPLAVAVITVPDDVRTLKISGVTQSTLADIGISGSLLAQVSYDGGATWVTDNAYYSGWAGRQASGSDNTFSSSTSIGNSFTLSSNSSYRDSPAIINALLHPGSATKRFVYQSTTSAREIGFGGSNTSFSAWSLHGFMRDVGRITNLRLFPHNGLIDAGSQIIIEGC